MMGARAGRLEFSENRSRENTYEGAGGLMSNPSVREQKFKGPKFGILNIGLFIAVGTFAAMDVPRTARSVIAMILSG